MSQRAPSDWRAWDGARVEFVGDARGFVDDHETDIGEAADRVFAFREADDAGAVRKQERAAVFAIAARADAELGDGFAGFAEELAALPEAGAGDNHETIRMKMRIMNGFYGACCRFSPLASAIEDAAGAGGGEDLLLLLVGDEAEDFAAHKAASAP